MLINLQYLIEKYKLNINGVIHIGAHYGEEVIDYINIGVNKIVLFEPLLENFNTLQSKINSFLGWQKLHHFNCNIVLHKVALGNKTNQKVFMNLSTNNKESSSILEPCLHLTAHPEVCFIGQEEVDIKKLDEYEQECSGCNFLSIDVQGYELEVLKGGFNILKNIDYIYCEVNRGEVYKNAALVEDIDKFLKEYNFDRVETYWHTDLWGDALYM
jgi:FkbM family methyltransferase